MKLLLDDKATRGYDLNANEACIFAAVLKCTRAGRGWYGNYRELAAAMPFVINRMTATRAVQKLLTLGLITKDAQNVLRVAQNVHDDAQNVLPPNNPPIINNNMNEKEKEQPRALRTHDGKPQTPSFEDLIKAYEEKAGRGQLARNGATDLARDAWGKCSSAKKIKLVEAIKSGAHFKQRLDWSITDFPEPKPEWKTGGETDEDLVQVRYNGAYKICTRATMELFGLEWVRDW